MDIRPARERRPRSTTRQHLIHFLDPFHFFILRKYVFRGLRHDPSPFSYTREIIAHLQTKTRAYFVVTMLSASKCFRASMASGVLGKRRRISRQARPS